MPAGRPSLYDPAYCEQVIGYGSEGMSVVEMCAEIGVSRNTLEVLWTAAHPEFMQALGQSRDLSQAWWEKQGRTNLTSDKFQSALYSRSMAARFPKDWRETKAAEISGPNGAPIQTQSLPIGKLSESALREIAGLGEQS